MSKVLNFVFCIMFAGFASAAGIRHIRSTGSVGGSSSFSSSSSSSSSGSGTSGGTGGSYDGTSAVTAPHSGFNPGVVNTGATFPGMVYPGSFLFPTGPTFGFPNPIFPVPNFMNQYQQWLAQFTAIQQQAAQQQQALYQAHLQAQQKALAAQQQSLAKGSTQYPNVDSNTILPDARMGTAYSGSGSSGSGTPGSSDFVFTGASIGVGPEGGHGEAASFPGGPDGLGARISEDYEPPSQGPVGVFTSSSSGTSTINGKTTSFKTSTFGKNDNGKITFRTINE